MGLACTKFSTVPLSPPAEQNPRLGELKGEAVEVDTDAPAPHVASATFKETLSTITSGRLDVVSDRLLQDGNTKVQTTGWTGIEKDEMVVSLPSRQTTFRTPRPIQGPRSDASRILSSAALSYPPFKKSLSEKATTGTPFLRAPLRSGSSSYHAWMEVENPKPENTSIDGRNARHLSIGQAEWAPFTHSGPSPEYATSKANKQPVPEEPSEGIQVPVGISRLQFVELPNLEMKPIYWSPVNDLSLVVRGTWFYRDTMLPVEVDVSNRLELGYLELKPWTETWTDELNSAVAVGVEGESRVLHRIWPRDKQKKAQAGSRPVTATLSHDGGDTNLTSGNTDDDDVRSIASLSTTNGVRHIAAQARLESAKSHVRRYTNSCVLYKNHRQAFILRPNLFPSAYYGRRPVAKIRKGVRIGIAVVRGFDWKAWHKIHPAKITTTLTRAQESAATSTTGIAHTGTSQICGACWLLEQPQDVTDLIFVIHG